VADILGKVDSISRDVQLLTTTLRRTLVDEAGLEDLRRTIGSAQSLITVLEKVATEQSRELTQTQRSFRRLADAVDPAQVDSTVRAVGAVANSLTALTSDLQGTTARLNGVLQKLESGEGSAGRLVNDPGLYTDVRALVQRLDSLTADFQKNPKKYINVKVF
jgi:phospholipid/cholesterol/gamma-HCH transport system substrate-binding protein